MSMLHQATKHWATIYNINITPPKNLPTPLNPCDRDTNPCDRDSDRAGRGGRGPGPWSGDRSTSECPTSTWSNRPPASPEGQQYTYPAAYPTSQLFRAHLTTFRSASKTIADIIMFKPAFANPGCFICRIKEDHRSQSCRKRL